MGGCSPSLWQMKGQGSRCLGKGPGVGCACAALGGASQLGRAPSRRGTSALAPTPGIAGRQQADTVEIHQGFTCPSVPQQALQWERGSWEAGALQRFVQSLSKVSPSEHKEGPALPAPQPGIFVGQHCG